MLAACATSSTPGIWTPTRIARGTGGLVSMIRRSARSSTAATAVSYVWPMPDTFSRRRLATSSMYQQDDGALRGFADRIHFASPRPNGAAAFMDGCRLNDKAPPFQREAKGFVGRGLLRVNPDYHHAGGPQEAHQPIKRDLKGFERAPPPID